MTSSKQALLARKRQWALYQQWQDAQPPEHVDLESLLRWYRDAWKLAAQFGWGDLPKLDPEKYERLRRWREAVGRIRL